MQWTDIDSALAYTIKGCGTVIRVKEGDRNAMVFVPNAKIKGKELVRVNAETDWN